MKKGTKYNKPLTEKKACKLGLIIAMIGIVIAVLFALIAKDMTFEMSRDKHDSPGKATMVYMQEDGSILLNEEIYLIQTY